MMTVLSALLQELPQIPAKEIGWVGIVIPGIVFTISFVVTYLLYRHFSKITK